MSSDSDLHLDEDIRTVEGTAERVAGKAREKSSEFGRKALAAIEERRLSAADGLDGAARRMHERAESIAGGGERISRATHGVADKVEGASRYLRSTDTRDMLTDVEDVVRAHPVRSLFAVLAVGFLAGRLFRSGREGVSV